jgi:hypothetical protein
LQYRLGGGLVGVWLALLRDRWRNQRRRREKQHSKFESHDVSSLLNITFAWGDSSSPAQANAGDDDPDAVINAKLPTVHGSLVNVRSGARLRRSCFVGLGCFDSASDMVTRRGVYKSEIAYFTVF